MSISANRSQFVFKKTEKALLKLASTQAAEVVHGFRTASLRLQTLLEHFFPERDRNQKKLLKMLSQIRRRAGKVRDLDVELAALRSLKVPQQPRRKTRLMHALTDLRGRHEKKLRKMLTNSVIRELQKRLKRASNESHLASGQDALKIAQGILNQVVRPAGPLREEMLQTYRTAIKSARYAAELAPKSAEADDFIAEVKKLQNALGNWHDWLILTEVAAKRLGDVSQSSLVALLHNVTAGKMRTAVAAVSASSAIQPGNAVLVATAPSRKVSAKSPTLIERIESAA